MINESIVSENQKWSWKRSEGPKARDRRAQTGMKGHRTATCWAEHPSEQGSKIQIGINDLARRNQIDV